MPLIKKSSYQSRPFYLPSRHLETIVPSVFYKTKGVKYEWEKLHLEDGDFLDMGWVKSNNKRLIIGCHGFEGNVLSYMKRSAKYFSNRNWDYLSWNYRGCSRELNKLPKLYYYGGIEDFQSVIDYALNTDKYDQIVLLGFSMGGCLVNKYLGSIQNIDPRIKGSVTYSVSCDLRDTIQTTENESFGFYNKVFKDKIKSKLKRKAKVHPEFKNIPIESIQSFDDYIRHYTMPFHDFQSVDEFYKDSSCANFLEGITLPSLMINALNDPILGEKCFPYDTAKTHKYLYLETPRYGSHLGFSLTGKVYSWMEQRASEFIDDHILGPE